MNILPCLTDWTLPVYDFRQPRRRKRRGGDEEEDLEPEHPAQGRGRVRGPGPLRHPLQGRTRGEQRQHRNDEINENIIFQLPVTDPFVATLDKLTSGKEEVDFIFESVLFCKNFPRENLTSV